jgi:hypothetical protein
MTRDTGQHTGPGLSQHKGARHLCLAPFSFLARFPRPGGRG